MKNNYQNSQKSSNKKAKKYFSLREIAMGYKINPKWAAEKWLSEPTTLELIQLWEKTNNINFNNKAYIHLCTNCLSHGSFPNVDELATIANVKSIFQDSDFKDEIYIVKDLAYDFASWLSPSFRSYCSNIVLNPYFAHANNNFKSEKDFVVCTDNFICKLKDAAYNNYKAQSMYSFENGYNYLFQSDTNVN